MTLAEYVEYIKNPLAEVKARVLIVSPGDDWTTLRRFYKNRNGVELHVSDLVKENSWLPMPDEVFKRVRDAMEKLLTGDRPVVLLGLSGYLSLLTCENRWVAIALLREWLDSMSGQDAICLLRRDDSTLSILNSVLANPRYRQGMKMIEIGVNPGMSDETDEDDQRAEVLLVGEELEPLIPGVCDTFQKFLKYTEDYPSDRSVRRIVVASEGRQLAGISAEIHQVVRLRDFAQIFHDISDPALSEDAMRWICEQGNKSAGTTIVEVIMSFFFKEGGVKERVLKVFDSFTGVMREAVFWLVKQVAPKGSYLEYVVEQQGVVVGNFRSAYVTGASGCLDSSGMYASERREAIREADALLADADIRQFIVRCSGESTSRVAPWLNCETRAERAELLRRCTVDGVVSNFVKKAYPETNAYLNRDRVYDNQMLEEYFREYRELKLTNCVKQEFFDKAERLYPPNSVQSRDSIVQLHASDEGCALLVVDAMGAEWLPMLVVLARERNIGVESVAVGKAHIPSTTMYNKIHWPYIERRLPDIKRPDNIAHHGEELYESRRPEENLAAELSVIGSMVIPRVAEGLASFERVLVTADHGSTRLAVLAGQSEPKLARTLECEDGAELLSWRYRSRAEQGSCPPSLEETLDGKHWVVSGYNRLPKKGGGQGFELHGGATLEERLVPIVVFSRSGTFVPDGETSGARAQIVENEDFDL